MKLYLIKGFDGEVVHYFGEYKTVSGLNKRIAKFKEEMRKSGQYKVDPFETVNMFDGYDVIDFGDYCYFLKVEKK